jgi:hypothetical protein
MSSSSLDQNNHISNECTNDFIVEEKNVKVYDESCEINVKRKFTVINDLITPLDFDIGHTIIKPNSHKESCDLKEIKANPNSVFDSN